MALKSSSSLSQSPEKSDFLKKSDFLRVERKKTFIKFEVEVTQLTTWPQKVLQALAMRVLRNPIFSKNRIS
jgi:hypothetical protein